jgi:hypothetical protein
MHRMLFRIAASSLFLMIILPAYGQSLGDIARENREKKTDDASATPPRVITNKDLPKDPAAHQEASTAPVGTDGAASSTTADPRSDDHRAARRSAEQRLAEQRAAEQWKRQILAQKNKVVTLQTRIDLLKASMQPPNSTAQYESLTYNRYQARQWQRIEQAQHKLDEQKMKLDQMQEAARHAGMRTAVYDP